MGEESIIRNSQGHLQPLHIVLVWFVKTTIGIVSSSAEVSRTTLLEFMPSGQNMDSWIYYSKSFYEVVY